MTTPQILLETGAFICGSSSVWLVGRTDKWKKWGYIMGILSQPFWATLAIQAEQWIILGLVAVYLFAMISKAQVVSGLKANLNRWVEEYNSKSKQWGRSLWKSDKLPYELSVSQFNCYNN